MNVTELKNIVEGFIFASDKAISSDQILKLFPEAERPEKDDITHVLEILEVDYQDRGIMLKKVSSGYRFQVKEEFAPWVSRLWDEKPAKYTRALLETLAIIVYRQPITRGEIENIRGVAVSSHIIKTLVEREWIRVIGQRDVPGRPSLYGSTKQFLDYFNLESLEELPPLSEIKDLDEIVEELDPEQNAALLEAIREIQENSKLENIDEESFEVEEVAGSSNVLEESSDALLAELKDNSATLLRSSEESELSIGADEDSAESPIISSEENFSVCDAGREQQPDNDDKRLLVEKPTITDEMSSDDPDESTATKLP